MLTPRQQDTIVQGIIDREGGLSDDPRDPGGLTKYGISQRAYPLVDIRNLTRDDAAGIYKRDYLRKFRLNELNNAQNAEIVCDWLVNGGGVKVIQRAVGVEADGVMGPLTLKAIDVALPRTLLLARLDYYVAVTKHPFLRGWVNRLKELGL